MAETTGTTETTETGTALREQFAEHMGGAVRHPRASTWTPTRDAQVPPVRAHLIALPAVHCCQLRFHPPRPLSAATILSLLFTTSTTSPIRLRS